MSEIALDPTSFRAAPDANPFVTKSQALGRDEFMRLLTTQLENQDPLEPMKDQEFVAQLATFSSLEQLVDLNKRMDNVITGQSDMVNSQALNLIGKHVLASTGGQFRLGTDGAEPIVCELPESPTSFEVQIADASGKIVRTIKPAEAVAGQQSIVWDGKDDNGNTMKAGSYSYAIQAEGKNGQKLSVPSFVSIPVDGIRIGANGLALVSGSRVIPFDSISEIRNSDQQ